MTLYTSIINIYRDAFSGLSRSIWLLSLIMLINRAGSMVIPFLTLYLTSKLDFSLTNAGYIMMTYGMGSVAGAYVGGQLTDKYGYYHVQFYSLILSSAALVFMLWLTQFYAIGLVIFSFAFLADAFRPANSVAVSAYSKPENRTRSFSLMRFAINLGYAIGPAIGGLLIQYLDFEWIFIVNVIVLLFAAALLRYFLPYEPASKPQVVHNKAERGLSAYKDGVYLVFVVLVSFYAMGFFQLFASVPVFFDREWGLSAGQIGMVLAVSGLIIALLEMPLVRRLEHTPNIMQMIALGCFFMILSFVALLVGTPGLLFAFVYIAFITFSEMFAMPFMINFAVFRPSKDRQGQYMALYTMAFGAAHIIAPVASMYLADHYGFATAYAVFAILSLLLVIGFYMMRGREIRS